MHRFITHWTRPLHVDLVESTASAVPGLRADWRHLRNHLDRATAALRHGLTWFSDRLRARRMRGELKSLDDLMLRDLGMHRGEIDSVVAELVGQAAPTRIHAGCRSRQSSFERHR